MCEVNQNKKIEHRQENQQPVMEQVQQQEVLQPAMQQELQQNEQQLNEQQLNGQQDWENVQVDVHARSKSRLKLAQDIDVQSRSSEEMINVKRAVQQLAEAIEKSWNIRSEADATRFFEALTDIEDKYIEAIGKCSIYLKKKDDSFFYYNKKRYESVKNTREMLEKELGLVAQIRQAMEENPQVYHAKKISFTDLAYALQSREEDPINKLELKDFIRITTDADGEKMLCRNGRLYKLDEDNSKLKGQKAVTKENYQMARRFIEILLEQQNIASDVTKEKITRNMLYRLGVNVEKQTAGPVSMEQIKELILETNSKLSDIDTVLADKSAEAHKLQIAQQIDRLLGKSLVKASNKSILKKQIKGIMRTAEHSEHWKATKLSGKNMELLVNGAVDVVRERAFDIAERIYKNKVRLANGAAAAEQLSDEEMSILLGQAISEVTASQEVYKDFYAMRMLHLEEELTLKNDDQLKKDLKSARIDEFYFFSAEEVRKYLLQSPDRLKELGDTTQQRECLQTITAITENMQEMIRLENKGLEQGLDEADAQLLQKKAKEIDKLYISKAEAINRLRSCFEPRTVVSNGLKRLDGMFAGGESVYSHANRIVDRLKTNKPGKALPAEQKEPTEVVSEYLAAKHIIDTFPEKARAVAEIFLNEKHPFELIKRQGNNMSRELMALHDSLAMIGEHEPVQVNIHGTTLTFVQEEDILTLQAGRKKVALPFNAAYWAGAIEGDICSHFDSYEPETAKRLLGVAARRDARLGSNSRANYERFLTNHLGITTEEMNNLGVGELREYVRSYCEENIEKEQLKDELRTRSRQNMAERLHINSQAVIESLAAMERMEKKEREAVSDTRKKQVEFAGEENDWTPYEKGILNFVGDIYFSDKATDGNFTYDANRMKAAILDHLNSFIDMVNMSDLQRNLLNKKFSFFKGFEDALKAVEEMVDATKELVQETKTFNVFLFETQKKVTKTADEIRQLIQNGDLDEVLDQATGSIQKAVDDISEEMQGKLTESVENLSEETDDQWKDLEQLTIAELVEQGMTGEEGEGAFNRKVMSGYIREASPADKQNMVASAFKNVPYIGLAEVQRLTEEQIDKLAGKFIAGYIKGAGPLLHKTLQGIPISNMPPVMQEAVKDVRSNLTKIDEKLVDAQLHQIIKESNNTIERIEKRKVLGAASVGETILVRVYEKGATQGVDKVVKLLRPDVQNHMARELAFMEKCAKEVDVEAYKKKHNNQEPPRGFEGGMIRTYREKTAGIKRELDLRLEADNVETGRLYEDKLLHISSMKLDPKTKKMSNVLVLEKAPGESVDKYIAQKDGERKKIVAKRTDKHAPKDTYQVLRELEQFRADLRQKQRYLINMSRKWMEEALFRSGFFHGDLHAGNVMIDDNGVTIIDYGNAHKFSKDDQEHVVNLIAAAQSMNTKRFWNHLKGMLSEHARGIYSEKQEVLYPRIKTILKKEDVEDPVQKILVVLNECQKEGIEIPGSFYSFTQSFARVWGTLEDYDTLVDKVGADMVNLMENPENQAIEKKPDAVVMPAIMKNILYRYEEKYKDYSRSGSLKEAIDESVNGTKVNIDPILDLCKERDLTSYQNLNQKEGMESFARLVDPKFGVIKSFIVGDGQVGKYIHKIRYDSSCTGEEFCGLMKDVTTTLGVVPGSMLNSATNAEKRANDCQNNIEIAQRKIEELTESIHALEANEENQPQELERLRAEQAKQEQLIRESQAQIEQERATAQLFRSKIDIQQEIVQEMEEEMSHQNFRRERIVELLDRYVDTFRDIMLDGVEDPNERQFMLDLLEMTRVTVSAQKPDPDMTEAEIREWMEGPDYVELTLSKQDKERERADELRAIKKLQKSAQKVFENARPKTYKKKLVETILDAEKFAQLGVSLQEWYKDNEGESLKAAYESVRTATQQGQLQADSPQVKALVDAIVRCVKLRAENMDRIIKEKNTKDATTDAGAMAKGLLWDHWFSTLRSLDRRGMVYLKKRTLSGDERRKMANRSKRNHTRYVEQLFSSMRESDLKAKANRVEAASKAYARLEKRGDATQKQMQDAGKEYNDALQVLLQTLCTLKLSNPGKKHFKSLLDEYERAPSEEAMKIVLREMHRYLHKQLENTLYTDPRMNEEGEEIGSEFENVYAKKLGQKNFLTGCGTLRFVTSEEEELNIDGEQKSLFERLQENEELEWVR